MKKEEKGERGLIVRILSNPDIQKGLVFFAVALILAFSAVITTVEEDVDKGTIGSDEIGLVTNINYPRFMELDNATLRLEGDEEVRTEATIRILNSNYENITLPEGWTSGRRTIMDLSEVENKTLDMTSLKERPRHISFNVTQGNLTYTYTVSYPTKPYSILSLPAAALTLIGMVYAFKGKGVILGEIKRKQMEKEQKEREKKDLKSRDEVVYEGDGSEKGSMDKDKSGEADHIDFMGVPDGSEEDEED
ncbi:MAG: hypothetical protein ACOCTR_02395 [Candidatus Natronoplasma sp.]